MLLNFYMGVKPQLRLLTKKERGGGNIKKANPKVRLFKFLIWRI